MVTQTRKLTEGAMMVALVGLMLFVNLQLGGMPEALMYWVLTFPILIYTAKYGIRNGLIAAFSTTLLSFMISSPTTIFYLFSCNVCGLFYGEGIRKKWKNGILYIGTAVFTFLSYLVTTIFFSSLFGYDPKDDIEMISYFLSLFHFGQDLNMVKLTGMIILLSTILLSAMQALCIHLFAHILLMRLKIETRKIKTIFEIHLPSYVGLMIFFIWVLYFMRNVIKLNQEVLGALVFLYGIAKVLAIFYGLISLCYALLLFKQKKFVFFVILAAFVPYVQMVVAFMGVIDMFVDLKDIFLEIRKRGVVRGSSREF